MVVMVLIVSAHLSPGRGRFLISFSQRLLRTLGFAFVLSWSRLLVVLFLLMTLETIIFSSCSNKLHRPRNMLTIGHGSHHQVLVYFKSGNIGIVIIIIKSINTTHQPVSQLVGTYRNLHNYRGAPIN